MRRRSLLAALAAGVIAVTAGALLVVERGTADTLACDAGPAAATADSVVVVGCGLTAVGTMTLDALSFGDHNEPVSAGDILSFRWELTHPVDQSVGAVSPPPPPNVGDIVVTRLIDKASPILMRACALGTNLRSADFRLFRSPDDLRPYLLVRLTSPVCSGFALGNTGGHRGEPTETLSLSFSRIELRHTTQEGQETRTGYDVRQNRAF